MPPAFKPRRAHKKTRTGCKTCRQRKVKCDENKPVCSNCVRRGLESECEFDVGSANNSSGSPATSTSPCVDYASPASRSTTTISCHSCKECCSSRSSPLPHSSRASSCSRATPLQSEFEDVRHELRSENIPSFHRDLETHTPIFTPHSEFPPTHVFSSSSHHLPVGLPAPNSIHLPSLQLLHHWLTSTGLSMGFVDPDLKELWQKYFCSLALSPESPFLLHGILAITALHLASQENTDLNERRRWFITASTHHDATLRLFIPAVAEYVHVAKADTEDKSSSVKMLDTIIATGSVLSVWGFAIRAVKIPRRNCLVTSESSPPVDDSFLSWVPLTRGTAPIVRLFRENWQYDLKSSALAVITKWWDAVATSHPYQQQLDMLEDILKEPPAPEGYMCVPTDILKSTIEVIKDCYLKFFSMKNPMSAAASFAAIAADEFVAGLGINIGRESSENWRGDPRALILMAYHVVLFQILENILREKEKEEEDATLHPHCWWCKGVARMEINTIAEHLSEVDSAENATSPYRSEQMQGILLSRYSRGMLADGEMAVDVANSDKLSKSRGVDLDLVEAAAPGMGRWSRWMKWPLEMVQVERNETSTPSSTSSPAVGTVGTAGSSTGPSRGVTP